MFLKRGSTNALNATAVRYQLLTMLPILANVWLVWHRLYDAVLSPCRLVEHTLVAACDINSQVVSTTRYLVRGFVHVDVTPSGFTLYCSPFYWYNFGVC